MQDIWAKCLKCFLNQSEGFHIDEHVGDMSRRVVQLADVLNLEVEVSEI